MVQWLSDKTDTTIFDILSWSLSTSNCLNEVAANQKNYEDVFFFFKLGQHIRIKQKYLF